MYRSWDRDWGFCVTRDFYDSLEPGEYEVVIETKEAEGDLKLLEYTHQGRLDETFVIAAHLDHPGMANDDLAGCAAGVELFRRLRGRETKFTYKLFLHQEVIGSEYYLGKMADEEREKILDSLFLEMLGSKTQLALQFSRHGDSIIDYALADALEEGRETYRTGPFGSIIAVGDFVWESYGIPMATLSRYPYPEYHCSRDNFDLMDEKSLDESVEILLNMIEQIESTFLVIKNFTGTICTSNPKYDLYVDPGQASFGGFSVDQNIKGKRTLMDIMPIINKPIFKKKLAKEANLDIDTVIEYLHEWKKKKLITFL
jgi:aminopeptidase-like protein